MLSWRVDPRPVAVARIGLGVAGLITVLELYLRLAGLADGRLAMPLFDWAPPVTSTVAQGFLSIGVVATVAIIIGIGTSAGALVYSLITAAVLLWDQQMYSSHQLLSTLLITYLAFARSDRAFAVRRRTGPRPTVPWWPQLLMMTQLTALYLFAGLAKINPVFLSGEPLSGWIGAPLPEWMFQPMAWATVVTETLVLAVGLWVPRFRVLAMVAGVGLHLSIITMVTGGALQLTAFALACVPLYPLFLARPRLRVHEHEKADEPTTQDAPRPTVS